MVGVCIMQIMRGCSAAVRGMQSIEHCAGGCTTRYAVRACCTVCNTHFECFGEAVAEWVMFKADLWNVDSLSSATFLLFGHCVRIGVQRDSFPAPLPSGKAILVLQKNSKVSSLSAQRLHTLLMAGGEKSIGEAFLVNGFLRKLGSRNLQTQAVLLEQKLELHLPSFMVTYERHTDRQTDEQRDGHIIIEVARNL